MENSYLKANYIAIQILYFLEKYGYSPNSAIKRGILIGTINGNEVTLASAYRTLKKNVNYVDDDLLEKINSYPCIFKKLEKNSTDQ